MRARTVAERYVYGIPVPRSLQEETAIERLIQLTTLEIEIAKAESTLKFSMHRASIRS